MSSPHKEVPRLEPHEAKMPGVISLVRTRWLPFERAAASYFITLHKFGYSSPIPYSTPPFCPDYVVSSPKPWFLGGCSPYSHLAAFLSLPVEPRSLNRAHTSRYCCTANDPHGSAMISCSENPKEQKNTLKPTGHIILCMCLSVIWFINHLRTEIHMQMFQTFPKSHFIGKSCEGHNGTKTKRQPQILKFSSHAKWQGWPERNSIPRNPGSPTNQTKCLAPNPWCPNSSAIRSSKNNPIPGSH